MRRLEDLNVDELVEQLFGADLDTLSACRIAEDDLHRIPPGRDRRFVVYRLGEAQDLWREGHAGPAVVVAQSVAEAYFEESMNALFAVSGAEVLAGPVKNALRDFQLSRKEHLNIYGALASDHLAEAPFWSSYKTGAVLRNRWVHSRPASDAGNNISLKEAEAFVLAVVDLLAHLEDALHNAGVKRPTEQISIEFIHHQEDAVQWKATFLDDGESMLYRIAKVGNDRQIVADADQEP